MNELEVKNMMARKYANTRLVRSRDRSHETFKSAWIRRRPVVNMQMNDHVECRP